MNSIQLRNNTLLHHNIPRRHSSTAANMASDRDIFLHTGQRLHMRRLIHSPPTMGSNTGRHRHNATTVIKKAILKPRMFTQKMITG